MADAVSRHAQQTAAAAAGYEARLEDGRRELAAVQVHVGCQSRGNPSVSARSLEAQDLMKLT